MKQKTSVNKLKKVDLNNLSDQIIIDLFKTKSGKLVSSYQQILKYPEYSSILEYLLNRYDDSESISETIFRLFNNIEVHPKCPICGELLKWSTKDKFTNKTCSEKCRVELMKQTTKQNCLEQYGVSHFLALDSVKNKRYQTNLKRYGSENVFGNKEIQEKSKRTNRERYGTDNAMQSEIIQERLKTSMQKRYGVDNPWQAEEVKEKIKETWMKNYGVDNPNKNKEVRRKLEETNLKKYDASTALNNPKIYEKGLETKRIRKTFNSSKIEESCYIWLCEEYGPKNVQRQYNKDPRYPFLCDFYISSLDLFIEIQGHWTHGPHPFDPSNSEDIALLEYYKEKTKISKFYQRAVEAFGKKDPLKREIAKKNNIRFLEMWGADFSKQDLLNAIQEALKSSI